MGASVDGASVHSVVTSCALFGALFVVLSALSVAILVAVNWRPWRIYRYYYFLSLLLTATAGELVLGKSFFFLSRFSSFEVWNYQGRQRDVVSSLNAIS